MPIAGYLPKNRRTEERHLAVVTKVVIVCGQCSECQHEEIQNARVNGRSNYDSLKFPTNVSAVADRPASYKVSKSLLYTCQSHMFTAVDE